MKEKMEYIVSECMGESPAPCVATCPMHTDVKEYMRLAREGRGEEALDVVRQALFLPSVLGRVCAAPCERLCKYNEVHRPLSIHGVKRYLADHFDDPQRWDLKKAPPLGKKVAIIGSGAAGLQSAVDLSKNGVQVDIYEKLPQRGGMMAVGIPSYRLPRDILERDLAYLDKLGVQFHLNTELGTDITLPQLKEDYDAVIIALGKHKGMLPPSVPYGEEEGVLTAPPFLREVALEGKSTPLGQRVLVIGGGDVAMDCCRVARRLAPTVYSACLERTPEEMPSSEEEIHGAVEEGIQFNYGRGLFKLNLNKENRVCRVDLQKCQSIVDEEGRFAPCYDSNDILSLEVDTVIFAIGQGVDISPHILPQEPNGLFQCDPDTLESPHPSVFICGDASGRSATLIQAMATGRQAADSVLLYLKGQSLREGRDFSRYSSQETNLNMPIQWTNPQPRTPMPELAPMERVTSFQEVALGYTAENLATETARCQQCQCRLCMKECIFLNDYCSSPKTLFQDYLDKGYENMEKMIAFSCNDCSQCRMKCPKNLDLQHCLIGIKAKYIEDNEGKQVIELLKPYDTIQEMECSPKYSITVTPWKSTKYLFVPGCTVPAYSGDLIEKSFRYLQETLDEVGCMLQCCGKVTLLNGEVDAFRRRNAMAIEEINESNADVIITICPSCYNVYRDTAEKPVISYWDLMREKIGIPAHQKGIGKDSDVVFNIHDPCPTRDVTSHHDSIRWILDELGYRYEEIERNRENTRCCGVGGMVCSSNPELYQRIYQRRGADFPLNHLVTYCGSCRGTMEAAGKDSLHILNLIFGETYTKAMEGKRSYRDSDEMWKNRLDSKERLSKFLLQQ